MVQWIALDPPKVQIQVRFLVETLALRVCRMSTADYESARRGSIPRRGAEMTFSECAGSARDRAKVVGPTLRVGARSNSWRGHCMRLTLEPDGTATGCNPVQVGSTPTGVSDAAGPTAHAALFSCEAVGDVCSVHGF